MTGLRNKNFIRMILLKVPVILLFVSVLNDYDFNYSGLKYFSFNFSYILIFYYSLKKTESLGYTYIFIAGLFNDVVIGTPIGLSSLMYLILCGAASYLRNITLRPSLLKDGIFFLSHVVQVRTIICDIRGTPYWKYGRWSRRKKESIGVRDSKYFVPLFAHWRCRRTRSLNRKVYS